MDMEYTIKSMTAAIKEIGKIIKCMGREN